VRVDWEGHGNNCYRVGGGDGVNKFDLAYAEDPPAPLKAKVLGTAAVPSTPPTTVAAAAKPKTKPSTISVKPTKGKQTAAVAKGPHFAVGDQKATYPGYHAITMDEYVDVHAASSQQFSARIPETIQLMLSSFNVMIISNHNLAIHALPPPLFSCSSSFPRRWCRQHQAARPR
jgi:hypothetical protein